jgi:hypothetical protein
MTVLRRTIFRQAGGQAEMPMGPPPQMGPPPPNGNKPSSLLTWKAKLTLLNSKLQKVENKLD